MLKLKLQYFGHLIWRDDSLEKTLILRKNESRRREWQRMRWLDGITDEFEQAPGDSEGQGSLACCSPWGCRVGHDWATEQQQKACFLLGFPRQEYWSGLPFPSLGDLPDPGIKPHLLHWQVYSLLLSQPESPKNIQSEYTMYCTKHTTKVSK